MAGFSVTRRGLLGQRNAFAARQLGYTAVPSPSGDATGVTDQALISAVRGNAGNNGTLVFAPGTYWVTGLSHNVTGQRWVIGPNTTLKLAAAANAPPVTLGGISGILEGEGTIDGNSAGQSASNTGVFISGATQPIVKGGLNINNAFGHAITTVNGLPAGTLIEDVFILNPTVNGIFAQTAFGVDATDVIMRRIKVDKSSQSAASASGYGVQVHANLNGSVGALRNVALDDIEVKLPSSPTNTMLCIELWGGAAGGVASSRVTRAITAGGTMGVSLDHADSSLIDTPEVTGAKSNGIEIAACRRSTLAGAWSVDGQGITGAGVVLDGTGGDTRCSVRGGTVTGCTAKPIYALAATEPEIEGTEIESSTANNGIYLQNTNHATVSAVTLLGAGTALDGIVCDASTNGFAGGVIDEVTADGYTRGLVTFFSGNAQTIDDVRIGVVHPLSMSAAQVLAVVGSATVGPKVTVEGFPGFRGNTTGLTSAQIDALFPAVPYNGQHIVDETNHILLQRDGGKWYKSAALTLIA